MQDLQLCLPAGRYQSKETCDHPQPPFRFTGGALRASEKLLSWGERTIYTVVGTSAKPQREVRSI